MTTLADFKREFQAEAQIDGEGRVVTAEGKAIAQAVQLADGPFGLLSITYAQAVEQGRKLVYHHQDGVYTFGSLRVATSSFTKDELLRLQAGQPL